MANSAFTIGNPADAATQSDQETGTSTATFVSPGRQQYHPSAAKSWVSYNQVTSTTIYASYNVSSLTDNGTGDTTVNFTTNFSSINYAPVGSNSSDGINIMQVAVNTRNNGGTPTVTAPTVAACRIGVAANTIGFKDIAYVSLAFYGDQ